MVFHYRLWLLPMAALLFPLAATAQIAPLKQSHRDLPGELDMSDPQKMMSERLEKLHDLHSLQDHMQGLLHDPAFLRNLNELSELQRRQLREKLLKGGEGLQQDQNWNRILQQARTTQKLDQHQIEILRRWAERADAKQTQLSAQNPPNGSAPPTPTPGSNASSNAAPLPPLTPPEPSWFDRMEEETTKWVVDQLDDVGGDVVSALVELGGTEQGSPIAELLHELQKPDFAGGNLNEPIAEMSQYLPKMGELLNEQRGLWNEMRSLFRDTRTPVLPNLSVSKPAPPTGNESVWMPMLLVFSMLALMILLVRRMKAGANARSAEGAADEWRLGSWPVTPNGVSTREDVVRAFEYLALLRLGISAGACHHRALAARLGEQDGHNPARRLAADMLAWLYEKARYAPVGETLSPDEFLDARNALRLLAGVTTV
jgi:hypothetical protein